MVLALFMERYCFIVTVYKTKYYGYITILLVIFFNTIFNGIIAAIRRKMNPKYLENQQRLKELSDIC